MANDQNTLERSTNTHEYASTMLNGISNGGMIAGAAMALYNRIVHGQFRPNTLATRGGVAMIAAGSAIGAAFGWNEANITKTRIAKTTDELVRLRGEVAELKDWKQRVQTQPVHPHPARNV